MEFDGEKPDKITRGARACNDDKVIFENPLNWTTRSFIFAKQREYENGPPTPEASGETIVRGRDRGKCKEAKLYAPDKPAPSQRPVVCCVHLLPHRLDMTVAHCVPRASAIRRHKRYQGTDTRIGAILG